ncbi:hypothetical protein COO60DRAFT_354835 [Scenedesmus sp. NREL 46B-D3]|nr:hypothetical protein COO60DRAFT_354835 [Scenedesmus sp. NREL 46B-D3]
MTQDMQMRRYAGYAALPGNEGNHAGSSSGQHAGSAGVFTSLYTALGGWLVEPSVQDGLATTALDAPQSLSQVLEQMGNWALRGVMLNMCMPVTTGSSTRHTPLASRSNTPEDAPAAAAAAAAVVSIGKASASSNDSGGGRAGRHSASSLLDAAGGCAGSDVARRPPQQDAVKQQAAGAGVKPLSHSSSSVNLSDQQQLGMSAANPAGETAAADASASSNVGCSSRDTGEGSASDAVPAAAAAALLQQQVGRLRQEVSCLRTALGTLYIACSHLKEENQRLRSADEGGEELLSGALQQLLGQKSELQQEVARLRSENQALQELLEYTAAAAAGPAETSAADNVSWGCCESSSAQDDSNAQHATEYAAAGLAAAQQACCDGSSSAAYAALTVCVSSSGSSGIVDYHMCDPQQQQEAAEQQNSGYWLVTPAASPGVSPGSGCASAHQPLVPGNRCAEACSGVNPPPDFELNGSCPEVGSSSAVAVVLQLQLPAVLAGAPEDAAAAGAAAAAQL